jgi:hypothetical protein
MHILKARAGKMALCSAHPPHACREARANATDRDGRKEPRSRLRESSSTSRRPIRCFGCQDSQPSIELRSERLDEWSIAPETPGIWGMSV